MKAGWQVRKFGDVCELKKGKKPALSAAPANGYKPYLVAKYLRGAEPVEFASVSDKNSISVGQHEIIIICDGSNSGETFIGFEGILSSTMAKVAHGEDLDNKFLMYFLDSLFEQFNAGKTGSAIPHLDLPALRAQNLPFPPLPEQQRIVGILDAAFDGIATAKANAEQNLQNARALFESHLQSVFTQRGEGWVDMKLGEVADLVDCLHKTPVYAENGFPMVRVTDIKPGFLDLSKTRKVDEKTFIEFSKKRTPKVGDIVFSRVGSCGVSSFVNSDDPFCLGQNTVFILSKINPRLLYHFLNSPNAKAQFDKFIEGTTQPTISLKSIREISVPITPTDEQMQLVAKFDALREETQRLESLYQRKLAALDELKKSLLHQAFSGQL